MAKRSVLLACESVETCDRCSFTTPVSWREAREDLVGECPRAKATGRHRWRRTRVRSLGATTIAEDYKCQLCRVEVTDISRGSQRDPGQHDEVTTEDE